MFPINAFLVSIKLWSPTILWRLWFYAKFDCNFFNHFPCMYVGLIVREQVWEIGEESSFKRWTNGFRDWLGRSNLQKSHVYSTWQEDEESCQVVIFATVSWVRPTREGPAKVFVCKKLCFALSSLYPYYIYPYYPQSVRSAFQRENPKKYTWELEIIIPIIIYTFPCSFPQLLHLHL